MSLDFIGRLETMNGLFGDAFRAFCGTLRGKRRTIPKAKPKAAGGGGLVPLPAPPGPDPGPDGVGIGVGAPADGSGGGDDAATGASASAAPAEESWHQEQAKNRKMALEYVNNNMLANTIRMRLALEPLRQLLGHHLLVGSSTWEAQQRANLLSSDPGDSHGPRQSRHYPLTIAANNVLEFAFFARLRALWL